MTSRLLFIALALLTLGSCASKPKVYYITDWIPAGSRIEYYAQIGNGTWKQTMLMKSIPNRMNIRVAEKWALSAAQQRLGGLWRDYYFRVTPPNGEPVVVWQRRNPAQL